MDSRAIDLRAKRKQLGLTQAQLAARWGVPQSTISNWERGVVRMERPRMIADALRGIGAAREGDACVGRGGRTES